MAPPVEPQRIFVACEGGGAKGIAHIGALRALHAAEDLGILRIQGYAGTSAGSIVAALAAAGWRGGDMLGQKDGTGLLKLLKLRDAQHRPIKRAHDLLGAAGWASVKRSRALGRAVERRDWGAALWIATTEAVVRMRRGGSGADLGPLRDAVQGALSLKLRGCAAGGDVTFGELHARGLPLRIVAANVTKRRLRLFSEAEDKAVAVADAVAASCAIPGVFAPWKVGQCLYADGGIVSNLPAWAFDYELRLDEDATVVPLQIADPAPAPDANYWVSLLRTMVFGAAPLFTRNIPQLMPVVLRPCIGLLDFDAPRAWLDFDAAEAEAATNAVLARTIDTKSDFERLGGIAMDLFRNLLTHERTGPYEGQMRAAFAEPFGTPPAGLRLCYTVGYESSASDRLVLPIEGSITGAAYQRASDPDRLPLVFEPMTELPDAVSLNDPRYRMARNRVRARKLAFLAAMPINVATLGNLTNPPYVFVVDGTAATDLSRAQLANVARDVQTALQKALDQQFPRNSLRPAKKDRRRVKTQ